MTTKCYRLKSTCMKIIPNSISTIAHAKCCSKQTLRFHGIVDTFNRLANLQSPFYKSASSFITHATQNSTRKCNIRVWSVKQYSMVFFIIKEAASLITRQIE